MKNTFQTNMAPIVASLLALVILVLPVFAATGPAGTPPTGNVDANFNSVTAKKSEISGAAGHFENVSGGIGSGPSVDFGLPDFAIKSKGGTVDIAGQLEVTQNFPAPYAARFQGSLGGTPPEVIIANSSSAITTKGDISVSTGDINVLVGHIKAKGGIGSFYDGPVGTATCTDSILCLATSSCNGTDTIISCGSASSSGKTYINDQYKSTPGNTCAVESNGVSGLGSYTITSLPRCFNPNG